MSGGDGWHRTPQGDSGNAAEAEAEFLARYDARAFPPFGVTVDVVVLAVYQGRLAVLLVERSEHPQRGRWALPGGFVGEKEDLPEAAWHTLERETGLASLPPGIHLEQLGTYGRPDRDPRLRVVAVSYLALTPQIALAPDMVAGGRVRFWPLDDLRGAEGLPLAFDHAEIVEAGVERARSRLEYTTISLSLVQEPFTLADLRRVYETVWETALDPTNFRRSVLETEGFVAPLPGALRREHDAGRGRPAALFTKGGARLLSHVIRRPPVSDHASGRLPAAMEAQADAAACAVEPHGTAQQDGRVGAA